MKIVLLLLLAGSAFGQQGSVQYEVNYCKAGLFKAAQAVSAVHDKDFIGGMPADAAEAPIVRATYRALALHEARVRLDEAEACIALEHLSEYPRQNRVLSFLRDLVSREVRDPPACFNRAKHLLAEGYFQEQIRGCE